MWSFLRWFSGGDNQYMVLWDCMRHDRPTLLSVIALLIGVIAFYMVIAGIWWSNEKRLETGAAKSSLNAMKWVFILCAFCGYGFPLMKIWWPAWRLEVVALAVLNYFAWLFIYRGGLKPVVEELTEANQLKLAEKELRRTIDNLPVMAWMTKPDGYVYWYNEQWYKYTATSKADMEGMGWQSIPDPEYLTALMEKWQSCLATGKKFVMEFPLRSGTGEYRMFLNQAVPYRDKDGNILYWLGTNTDIQEVHEREIRLTQSLMSLTDLTARMSEE